MHSLVNFPIQGKKVLIRVDFNVPLDKTGAITDDSRIIASLPTIKYVLEKGGIPILMSHLGRPKGKPEMEYSLNPCVRNLSRLLGRPVKMAPDCIGKKTEQLVSQLQPGDCLLLENLRFHAAEEEPEKDPSFAEQLAKFGDFYIDDAFGSAHRKHSSIYTIVKYFQNRAAPGFLMEKEIQFLGAAFKSPRRPFYAIVGGAKISTKFGVLNALIEKVDGFFIGGAMAYTFLKAQGVAIGNSLYEPQCLDQAKALLEICAKKRVAIELPVDHVIAREMTENAQTRVVTNSDGIPEGYQGVDIGPQTIARYAKEFDNAATLFWNGPLGIFEIKPFAAGTRAIAEAMAPLKAIKIVGGGDSIAAVRQEGLAHLFTHLSTGGGASLEYIENGTLPGIEALEHI